MLGCELHYNTIHKFIQLNKTKTPSERYSLISDAELNKRLERLTERFPNSGVQEMVAHLRTENLPCIVQQARVRNLLPSIDPVGNARRRAQTISRITYNVQAPNSLWHIDTNHALIRYVSEL